ncbi:MAG: SprB repeat-containing protein [Chitinophagales bacterium]
MTQPGSQLGATLTPVNTSCYGGNDGSVTAAGVGGTAPYTYLWSDANIGATDGLLAAGLYVVTVTDSNSCQYVKAATVGQPAPIVISETVTPANCNGSPDGAVSLAVTGGTPGYTYGWSNGPTTPDNRRSAGIAATVTDTKNCTSVEGL